MAEFDNPYAEHDPMVQAHFECVECGGKLWEYTIQRIMFCEDCRRSFRADVVFEAYIDRPTQVEATD